MVRLVADIAESALIVVVVGTAVAAVPQVAVYTLLVLAVTKLMSSYNMCMD